MAITGFTPLGEKEITDREKALFWWRALSDTEQEEMAKKYHPNKDFHFITTASIIIEKMWKAENQDIF